MRVAYTYHEKLTFPDYLDQETGKTLTAVPGQSYDVAPASGRMVPDIPTGWFVPLEGQESTGEEVPPAEVPEPEHAEEHDGGEPQQF